MLNWLAVAIGGALGAMGRYGIALWVSTQVDSKWPWATFAANVIGCFLMGALYVWLVERHSLPEHYRSLFIVGFLGALTTFSTFSIEVVKLIELHELPIAIGYSAASLAICVLSVWLSITLVRAL